MHYTFCRPHLSEAGPQNKQPTSSPPKTENPSQDSAREGATEEGERGGNDEGVKHVVVRRQTAASLSLPFTLPPPLLTCLCC